jgi:Serine endopeptidase inhibitors
MRGRRKKDSAALPQVAQATPFFARFLEDQHGDDAEAKVSARPARAEATTKVTKTTATKTKAGGVTKIDPSKFVTLKYPSDNDEYVLYPYKVEAATIKGSTRQTLKYPSDRDEDIGPYVPVYLDAADVPKAAAAKSANPRRVPNIRLTSKTDDIDQR